MKWRPLTQMFAIADHADGRKLAIMVGSMEGDDWTCTAFEVPQGVTTAAAALDEHAHKLLGTEYGDVAEAMDAGEAFARAWLAGNVAADLCVCREIGAPTS